MKIEAPIARFRLRGGRVAGTIAYLCGGWMVLGTIILAVLRFEFATYAASFLYSLLGLIVSWIVAITRRGDALGVVRSGGLQELTADEEGVRIDGFAIPRADLAAGIREKLGAVHQVTFAHRDGRAIAVRVRNAAEAEELLEAARVSLRDRVLSLNIGSVQHSSSRFLLGTLFVLSVMATLPVGCVAYIGVATGKMDGPSLILMLLVTWTAVILSGAKLWRRQLTIGRDGVRVVGTLKSTFHGFANTETRVAGARLILTTGDSERRLRTTSHREAQTLKSRIDEARALFRERRAAQLELLARRDRSKSRWKEELAALLTETYRAPVDREELATVVEDPSAPGEQRIGAALALSSLPKDANERLRVRAAIATTVEPELRVALEAAAEGDVEDLPERATANR